MVEPPFLYTRWFKPIMGERWYRMKIWTVKGIRFFALTLLFLGGTHSLLWSFSFSPISQTFSPEGRGSTRTFRLKNEGEDYIAIRIKILTRSVTPEGKEKNRPADDLFTVYPAQVVVQPQSNQTVRIKWNGPSDIRQEQCFRVLVEQVPVQFENSSNSESNLKIMFRYLGALYITPEGAQPDVILETHSVEPAPSDASGRNRLNFTIYNQGNRHAILNNLSLRINTAGATSEPVHVIDSDKLEGISGENILPDSRRHFSVPLPSEIQGDTLQVEIEYDTQ